MAIPSFTVQAGFASNPLDSPTTYTDLTARARSITVSYGRNSEADAPGTGQSTTMFNNDDRALDPTNTGSTYSPNVLPERRIRVQAMLAGVTYPVFVHFADGWPQAYTVQPHVEVPVAATDGFELLAQAQLPMGTAFAQETTGTRIGHILDQIGWPAGERAIDTGQSSVVAAVAGSLDSSYALNMIQDCATTEIGNAFIGPDGTFTFHDRYHRLVSPYTTSQATFADDFTGYAYSGLLTAFDRAQIRNDHRVTASGGVEQAYSDSASITSYGRRTRQISVLLTTDSEAFSQAQFLTNRYAQPFLRFDEMTIRPGNDTNLWTQVLTRAIGDRITVVKHPQGGGAAIRKQVVIEAIRHTFPYNVADSATVWRLSPADTNQYWLAGVVGASEAGTTTRAVY